MNIRSPHRPLLDASLWLLALVMAVVVVWTSVQAPGDGSLPLPDKLLHFLAYTGLTLSILLAAVWVPGRGPGRFPTAALWITLLAFVFGVAIEVVQGPLPERDADLFDAVANAGGALTALTLWTFLRKSLTARLQVP